MCRRGMPASFDNLRQRIPVAQAAQNGARCALREDGAGRNIFVFIAHLAIIFAKERNQALILLLRAGDDKDAGTVVNKGLSRECLHM